MVKYLILGNGFIGNKFKEYFGEESAIGKRRINSIKDIHLELVEHKPEIIINCIGKTGRPNVEDVPNSVTIIDTLLETAKKLMDRRVLGPVHIVNEGVITHNEILEMYKEIVDPNFEMPEFIGIDELEKITSAGRSNCILVSIRLSELDIKIRNVRDAVRECLQEYGRYIKWNLMS